jgi:hypothetical protein
LRPVLGWVAGGLTRNVSDIKGETELAPGISALVTDQIDLHEPRYRVVPFSPGPHRDGVLQQRARRGRGTRSGRAAASSVPGAAAAPPSRTAAPPSPPRHRPAPAAPWPGPPSTPGPPSGPSAHDPGASPSSRRAHPEWPSSPPWSSVHTGVAMVFVTALRSLIESSMAHTGRTGDHRHGGHTATRAFSNDSSIAATRASVSQRDRLYFVRHRPIMEP